MGRAVLAEDSLNRTAAVPKPRGLSRGPLRWSIQVSSPLGVWPALPQACCAQGPGLPQPGPQHRLPLFTEGRGLCSYRVPGLHHPSTALPHTPPPRASSPAVPWQQRAPGPGSQRSPREGSQAEAGEGWGCSRRRQANLLFPGLLPAPDQPWAGVGAANRMDSQSQVGRGRPASGRWY